MEKGAVLKNGKVIDKSKLIAESLKFNMMGFLIKFSVNTIENKFVHVEVGDFNLKDFYNENDLISAGYFLESEFFKYLDGSITISQLHSSFFTDEKLKPLLLQEYKDIEVYRLNIVSPYDFFYKVEKANFQFKKNMELIAMDGTIIIPDDASHNTININFPVNNKGKEFYLSRKTMINVFPADKMSTVSYQLILIGIYINMINEDIFPSFMTGTNNYATYIDLQNYYWITAPDTFANPTLESLEKFLNNLKQYYKSAYPNKLKIQNSDGIEKLYWLGMSLSVSALSNLPYLDKLDLIKYLIKNKLSENFERVENEQLVIKLAASFDESNVTEINLFLANFINIDKENGDGTQSTLYEILYNKMSTSTNLKSGLLSLSNSWFGTTYKPTTTKADFVQAIYRLWYYSEYNPYNVDGSLRPNTLGFRSFNNDLSSFTSVDVSAYKYKYTHHTAYVKDSSSDPYNHYIFYKELYPDAAPMVIPYESEKILGVYFDNFSFKIEGKHIKMYQSLLVGGGDNQYSAYNEMDVLFGKYKIFQPVSLLNVNVETKSAISSAYGENILVNGQNINSFIPAFVLAHIDAEGDSSDAETMIGYTVDVATTFSGIGALTKMKHLRWASSGLAAGETALFSMNGLRIVVGGVEFTSGVLGFLANFVECGPDDDFCNSMKSFIMTLQIASLSVHAGDGIASFAMKMQAGRVIRTVSGSNPTEIINNIKIRLQALNNSNASPQDIDNLANSIYQSGVLYSTPLHLVAISLYEKLKKTYLLAQNRLYRNVSRLEDTPLNVEVSFTQMPRFSLYKYVEVIPPGNVWKRISDGDNYLHTEVELQDMIDKGIDLQIDELVDQKFKANNEVTQHFILKSFRTAKQRTKLEVFNQMETFKTFLTTRNKVPFCFSLTNNAVHFLNFKTEFLTILGRFDYGNDIRLLKYLDEYQISGSALYRTDPPDMDISGYIRRMHIRKLTEKNIEIFNKNKKVLRKQLQDRGRKDYEFERIESAILRANTTDQISAYALLRMDSQGNIYSLAEDISNMLHKPNTIKATDFNIFDVNITERRLQPDLTIKTN